MAGDSSIEWTGDTANTFYATAKATGRRGRISVKVSPGCQVCYAGPRTVVSSRSELGIGLLPLRWRTWALFSTMR